MVIEGTSFLTEPAAMEAIYLFLFITLNNLLHQSKVCVHVDVYIMCACNICALHVRICVRVCVWCAEGIYVLFIVTCGAF